MTVFHYDNAPKPVGNPVGMNGSQESYELGFYDGSVYDEQYATEPEAGVLFESPEGAREWLDAVIYVLTPYIDSGDRAKRVPDIDGWVEEN